MNRSPSRVGATLLVFALLSLVLGPSLFNIASAYAPTSEVGSDVRAPGQTTIPMTVTARWQTGTTLINAIDAATVTNPETQVTRNTTPIIKRSGGTTLRLRMAYDASLSVSTAPVVKVFGRTGADAWQLIKSVRGNVSETLAVAGTDVSDGTFKYTTSDQLIHSWDCDGCDQLLVVIETALAGTGTVNTAFIQFKFI